MSGIHSLLLLPIIGIEAGIRLLPSQVHLDSINGNTLLLVKPVT